MCVPEPAGWEIREGSQAVGLTSADWGTTLIASQFDYAPDTSLADLVRDRFEARGILIHG